MASRRRFVHQFLSFAAAGVSVASAADTTTAPAAPPAPATTFTLGGYANYAFDTDLHDDGGSFSVFRSGGSIDIDHKLNADTGLRLSLDGEWSHYFFRNLAAMPGDDGSDTLDAYQFDIRPTFTHQFSPNLSAFGGFTLTASGMADADFGDSLSYGVFAGVNYQISPKVWIGGGVSFITQLEDSPLVVPLITIEWDVTPDFTIASDGLGLRATYKIDDAWSVYARARYDYRQFRLSDDEIISGGVLNDQSVPVSLGVAYDFGGRLTASAEVGVVAWRRLEFRDDGGDQVGADEADPAAFASIQLRYAF